MQSPIYLSIVPSLVMMISVIGVKNLLMSFVNPCGSVLNCSLIGVNPRMSQNNNVSSLVSPPNFNKSGFLCNFLTIAGAR